MGAYSRGVLIKIFKSKVGRLFESGRLTAWLLLTFFVRVHNQLSSMHSIITYERVQMFENCNSSNGSKNEWLLLSASFTAKFELVFVLKLENYFS